MLFGPVVGSVLLLGLGATAGIFANGAIYLPMTLSLFRTAVTGHSRDEPVTAARRPRVGAVDAVRVLREVSAITRWSS